MPMLEGRQMAAPDPRLDISRLTFGVSDDWRLVILRLGHFPAKKFGSWTLGAKTSGAWKFGAPDKWQPRQLVAGKIHAPDVWRPDIWCPGLLAFETIPVWVKPRPDIWRSVTFGGYDIWQLAFVG